MPKVSVIILTKNRSAQLQQALASVEEQSFRDFEIVVVNDGSTDDTSTVLKNLQIENLKIMEHQSSQGITSSRQEALVKAQGEYVALLDDDDAWVDKVKLKKQVEFLDNNPDYVLTGGGIEIVNGVSPKLTKFRPGLDQVIRKTMLLRNNFFTSTVMFRREAAIKAGGFMKDDIDLAEDYDLWLRLGKLGKMSNFLEVFTAYTAPSYNKDKFKQFLSKQLRLIQSHKSDYTNYLLASLILRLRLLF